MDKQTHQRILITGFNGFIGRNLLVRLGETSRISIKTFGRSSELGSLNQLVAWADAVIHLAGENRPPNVIDLEIGNSHLTLAICEAIKNETNKSCRKIPLVFTSSVQAESDNPYGRSKRAAEQVILRLANETGNSCSVFRLPGVFGKWSRPNYNSVVATFCYNIARGLPITINDPQIRLRLVYIDDVTLALINILKKQDSGFSFEDVLPEYEITLGDLEAQIRAFQKCRTNLVSERVGSGLTRALYATYTSFMPIENFKYSIQEYSDKRGVFVEMLKTLDSGQFSYFTAGPGITRGGHYHHTKVEKFLVVRGEALFRFRHIITNELIEIRATGNKPEIVDTIPGWSHDVTNVGDDEMIVMLWANEKFNPDRPDTVMSKI